MMYLLDEIVFPYTKKQLACMTWDCYGVHLDEDVVAHAHSGNLHIIPCPPGGTKDGSCSAIFVRNPPSRSYAHVQPHVGNALDATVNGAVKLAGRRAWRKDQLLHPDKKVDYADAIRHCYDAFFAVIVVVCRYVRLTCIMQYHHNFRSRQNASSVGSSTS